MSPGSALLEVAWIGGEAGADVGGDESKKPGSWRHGGDSGASEGDGRSELGRGFILLAHTLFVEMTATKTAAVRTRRRTPQ